jgi:hypothetical protein
MKAKTRFSVRLGHQFLHLFMVCRCSAGSSLGAMAAFLWHVDPACASASWPGWRNRQAVRATQAATLVCFLIGNIGYHYRFVA